jgi:hypothetical protein
MSEKRWYLISYDIRDQKRWRQTYKQLKGCGERIHYGGVTLGIRKTINRRRRPHVRTPLPRLRLTGT